MVKIQTYEKMIEIFGNSLSPDEKELNVEGVSPSKLKSDLQKFVGANKKVKSRKLKGKTYFSV
jgi:hypothetical protein